MVEAAGQASIRARATGWSVISWVLFASSGPLAKAVMVAGGSPTAVTSVRVMVAAVLLVPVVAVLRPRALRFHRSDLWLLLGYGVFGVAGVQLLFFIAVERIPVGVAIVLVNLAPALASWIRNDRFFDTETARGRAGDHLPVVTRPRAEPVYGTIAGTQYLATVSDCRTFKLNSETESGSGDMLRPNSRPEEDRRSLTSQTGEQ
ncbi:EamA family transporter [Nocardia sp. CA-135953]|uniref:EamA family transporter n=1 Tax=Nocardia sp. CA-135953 TaxID=3239978 RepID=UPI003D96E853